MTTSTIGQIFTSRKQMLINSNKLFAKLKPNMSQLGFYEQDVLRYKAYDF
jgi:hypothetical protein